MLFYQRWQSFLLCTVTRFGVMEAQEINPEYSLEGLMLRLKLQHFDPWCKEPTHWKRPWCWERLKAGGEGDESGWDGWMASPIQWTWVWGSSRRWWRTGKPGSPWGCKDYNMTEQLNWKLYVTDRTWSILHIVGWYLSSIHLLQLPSSLLKVYTQFPNKHAL